MVERQIDFSREGSVGRHCQRKYDLEVRKKDARVVSRVVRIR